MKKLKKFEVSKQKKTAITGGDYWYVITRGFGPDGVRTSVITRFTSIGDAAAYANATGGTAGYHNTSNSGSQST